MKHAVSIAVSVAFVATLFACSCAIAVFTGRWPWMSDEEIERRESERLNLDPDGES